MVSLAKAAKIQGLSHALRIASSPAYAEYDALHKSRSQYTTLAERAINETTQAAVEQLGSIANIQRLSADFSTAGWTEAQILDAIMDAATLRVEVPLLKPMYLLGLASLSATRLAVEVVEALSDAEPEPSVEIDFKDPDIVLSTVEGLHPNLLDEIEAGLRSSIARTCRTIVQILIRQQSLTKVRIRPTRGPIGHRLREVVEQRSHYNAVTLTNQSMMRSFGNAIGANRIPARRWIVIGDEKTCPICSRNGAAGAVRFGQAFPSGHESPAAHPNCRCMLIADTVGWNPPSQPWPTELDLGRLPTRPSLSRFRIPQRR